VTIIEDLQSIMTLYCGEFFSPQSPSTSDSVLGSFFISCG